MDITEAQIAKLRSGFRYLNKFMLLMWRLGLGRFMASPQGGYVMVLVTTGRKSGLRRPVPLNFAEEPGSVFCLAGFGKTTHWLMNLLADPQCEVWLPDGRRMLGTGEIVTEEALRVEMIRRILIRAGFATKLAEPGLDPLLAPESEIAELGQRYGHRYEVVQIRLDGAAVGPGGPGDLAWVSGVALALVAAGTAWAVSRKRSGP